jgi:hypothetical protein
MDEKFSKETKILGKKQHLRNEKINKSKKSTVESITSKLNQAKGKDNRA